MDFWIQQQINSNVRMKLKQPRDLEMQDTPPIQHKARHIRYADDQNEDSANFVVQFRRRTKDNQLYHSQEFMKPKPQKSLVCNEVYDNSDFFKQSLIEDRNSQQGWVLTQSQENLLQQKKPRLDSSINFRSMRPDNVLTKSKEFLEEKQIVNDVIDNLIKKSQKSIEDHSRESEVIMCSNEDGKKAKYRMEDPDQELFYCSKCSIMLLQKGFQVTQLSQNNKGKGNVTVTGKGRNCHKNKEEFNEMSFKIRCLKESIKNAIHSIEGCDLKSKYENEQIKINDVYELIISVTDAMRKKDLSQLKDNFESVIEEKLKTKDSLYERYTELEGLESQVDNLDISVLEDERASKMLTKFNHTIDSLQQEPGNYDMTIIEETLDSRLERLSSEVKEHWPKGAIEFSFQKSEKFDNFIKEAKQPFRHLFPDDEEIKSNCFGNFSKPISSQFLKPRNI